MNPIIETVDQGHWSHGTKCQKCKTEWPCAYIVKARVDNHRTYLPPIPDTQAPIEPHKDKL